MLRNLSHEYLSRWLLAGACFAVLIFFFSPSWGAFQLWSRVPEMQGMLEVRRGVSLLHQVEHPGAEIGDPLHRVIQWRLLFPVLGHFLHLPTAVLFGLAHLGCFLVLGYVISIFRRRNLGWVECSLAATTLGAASWFFTSTGWLGYFDSWLAFGLLIAAFAEARWPVWLACLWAPWVDERFVAAAPLALLCRYLVKTSDQAPADGSAPRFDWRLDLAVPLALLTAFAGVRLGLLSKRSENGATVSGYLSSRDFLDAPLRRIALGVWEGLRAGWFFVFAAVLMLRAQPARAIALASAVYGLGALGLATAQDYSRSMTMLLPAAVLGVFLLSSAPTKAHDWLFRLGVVAALILPAHHVMNDRVNPIYYLYHELAALETPPATAMPELYELRAIHKMERGEFADAEADLTLAIKLAKNPAAPSRQRGILEATQGRWPDALRDFSSAAEYDSENPESWFMRAQANLAVGNSVAARADLDRALSLAPDGWGKRPDVTRFLAKLNQAGR